MCLRKHTNWACGHHTIRLSQCSEPPDRGCLALFFSSKACPAEDVFRIRDRRCPGCCERMENRERRSAEREARRHAMRASYDSHRSSTNSSHSSSRSSGPRSVQREDVCRTGGNRGDWDAVVPGSTRGLAAPGTARVYARPSVDRVPPHSSSRERGQLSKKACSRPTAGNEWDPVLPRGPRSSCRVNGASVRSPGSIWDPVMPRGMAYHSAGWTSVPLV